MIVLIIISVLCFILAFIVVRIQSMEIPNCSGALFFVFVIMLIALTCSTLSNGIYINKIYKDILLEHNIGYYDEKTGEFKVREVEE